MVERRNWSLEDVKEALALYLVTDFGRFHARNPDIIRLATRLGRTASAVALKLTNLAALDDILPQKGMANASATDREVWASFLRNPDDVEVAYSRQSSPLLLTEVAEAPAAFDHPGGRTTRLTHGAASGAVRSGGGSCGHGRRCRTLAPHSIAAACRRSMWSSSRTSSSIRSSTSRRVPSAEATSQARA